MTIDVSDTASCVDIGGTGDHDDKHHYHKMYSCRIQYNMLMYFFSYKSI